MPTPKELYLTIVNSLKTNPIADATIINANIVSVTYSGRNHSTGDRDETETPVNTDIVRTKKSRSDLLIDNVNPTDTKIISCEEIKLSSYVDFEGVRHSVIAVDRTPLYEAIVREI